MVAFTLLSLRPTVVSSSIAAAAAAATLATYLTVGTAQQEAWVGWWWRVLGRKKSWDMP